MLKYTLNILKIYFQITRKRIDADIDETKLITQGLVKHGHILLCMFAILAQ